VGSQKPGPAGALQISAMRRNKRRPTGVAPKRILFAKIFTVAYPAIHTSRLPPMGGREALMEAQRYPEDFNGLSSAGGARQCLDPSHDLSLAWDARAP